MQTTAYVGPTEILCRYDYNLNKPVVFIAHSMGNGQIQVWDGNETKFVPLHEYQRTAPLAKADEDVLAKRFAKQTGDKSVVVRQRLPRTPRTRPERLAITNTGPVPVPAKAQQQQSSQDVPAPAASPAVEVPTTTDPSDVILGKIKEESAKVAMLSAQVAEFSQKLQQATSDHDAAQRTYTILTAQYQAACEREAQEELQKRQQMLAEAVAPLGALKQDFPQGQQQQQQTPEASSPSGKNGVPRGAGGKFQKKAAGSPPAEPDAALTAFKQLSPAQRDAALKAAGLATGPA